MREFPGSPLVRTTLLLQGAQVQSQVRELRSHKSHNTVKEKKSKQINHKIYRRICVSYM